jgi:hypothetical protein
MESSAVHSVFALIDNSQKRKCILDSGCQIIAQNIISDPLQDLPKLPTKPLTFALTGCYTQEHKDLFDKLNPRFLLPAERDLLHYFMMIPNNGFARETSE